MSELIVGGHRKVTRTTIDESESSGAACLVPVSLVDDQEAAAYREAIREYMSEDKVGVNVLTRSMAKREKELDENEKGVEEIVVWNTVSPEGEARARARARARAASIIAVAVATIVNSDQLH